VSQPTSLRMLAPMPCPPTGIVCPGAGIEAQGIWSRPERALPSRSRGRRSMRAVSLEREGITLGRVTDPRANRQTEEVRARDSDRIWATMTLAAAHSVGRFAAG
jgi:hypothetical protein